MKKKQIILYVVVVFLLLTTSVYATISSELGFKIQTSSDIISPGDEFSVTLYLKDLNTDKKIKSVEGYIDINKDILEPLTMDSVVKDSDGKVKIDNDNILTVSDGSDITTDSDSGIIFNTKPAREKGDYRLVVNFAKPISSDVDLITLKFKVKDSAAKGEYSSAILYKLFGIYSDDAQEGFDVADKGIKVIINQAGGVTNDVDNTPKNETQNPPKNETQNPQNNATKDPSSQDDNNGNGNGSGTNNPSADNPQDDNNGGNGGQAQDPTSQNPQQSDRSDSGSAGTSGQSDSTVSPTNLPKTGYYKFLIIPIIVIACVGLVFYKKYSKYNNYHE